MIRKAVGYRLVRREYSKTLSADVHEMVQDGWEPNGRSYISSVGHYQSMVKYEWLPDPLHPDLKKALESADELSRLRAIIERQHVSDPIDAGMTSPIGNRDNLTTPLDLSRTVIGKAKTPTGSMLDGFGGLKCEKCGSLRGMVGKKKKDCLDCGHTELKKK